MKRYLQIYYPKPVRIAYINEFNINAIVLKYSAKSFSLNIV